MRSMCGAGAGCSAINYQSLIRHILGGGAYMAAVLAVMKVSLSGGCDNNGFCKAKGVCGCRAALHRKTPSCMS